ncbi:hypothetical protein, partial [Pseudomonas sp. FW215-E1]|uniref:hypothetical protein n=1 Tax=Pseudomonas sp. FW215-E1 TaxID=2070617 RepID=UPI000CBC99EA
SGLTLQFVVQVRKGDKASVEAFKKALTREDADELSRLVIEKKCEALTALAKFLQRRRFLLYVTTEPKEGLVPISPLVPRFRRS